MRTEKEMFEEWLGAMLIGHTIFYEFSQQIDLFLQSQEKIMPDPFNTIYKVMKDLFFKNIEINIVSVSDKLEELGKLKEIGGRIYINNLALLASKRSKHHDIRTTSL